MNKFKGIIFDFNGTLILDDELHVAAYQKYVAEIGLSFTREEYFKNMHGRPNDRIYEFLTGEPIPKELSGVFGQQKEVYYREMFAQSPPPFANGAVEMLDYLKDKGVPMAIATSSEISNVTFFKEVYNLDRWFAGHITYSDGTLRGKPAPDIFLKAGENLGLPMSSLVTVEDSFSGVCACKASGSSLVVGICPRGKEKFNGIEHTDLVITDFTEFDYKNLF